MGGIDPRQPGNQKTPMTIGAVLNLPPVGVGEHEAGQDEEEVHRQIAVVDDLLARIAVRDPGKARGALDLAAERACATVAAA